MIHVDTKWVNGNSNSYHTEPLTARDKKRLALFKLWEDGIFEYSDILILLKELGLE
jgi:hypothetical protein